MHCSTCGASIPRGRTECGTCGGTPFRPELPLAASHRPQPELDPGFALAAGVLTCPRCDYRGQGLPYFTRGPHRAALIGATLFTLPYALGAGGFLYYGMRHDHRVCPRCGHGWGRRGERALERIARGAPPESTARSVPAGPGLQRAWSIILFTLGAILLTVGTVEMEALVFVLGVLAAAGAVVLHRGANRAREERRAALISSLQMPVLKLAAERKGVLTVTDVAASLGWSMSRAEKILRSMDDGWRVSSEVTDEGVIVYEFRELLLRPGRHGGEPA